MGRFLGLMIFLLFLFFLVEKTQESSDGSWGKLIKLKDMETNNRKLSRIEVRDFFPLVDGSVIALFSSTTNTARVAYHLVKFDSSGKKMWEKFVYKSDNFFDQINPSRAYTLSMSVDEYDTIVIRIINSRFRSWGFFFEVFHIKFSSEGALLYRFTTKEFTDELGSFRQGDYTKEKSELPSLFSFNLKKRSRHEYKEANDNTLFLKDLEEFLQTCPLMYQLDDYYRQEFINYGRIEGRRDNHHIDYSFNLVGTYPIEFHTVDSINERIDDYLSEEEYRNMTLMERMEYYNRNKVVRSWEYKQFGGGFIIYKLSTSGEFLWKKHYRMTNDDFGIELVNILPSTSSDYANLFGSISNMGNISLFHLKLNTRDGSIEKSHLFLQTNFRMYRNLVDYKIFNVLHLGNKEVFYLDMFSDGLMLVKLDFEDEKISILAFTNSSEEAVVSDIFWNENKEKLFISIRKSSPFSLSDYYIDDEKKRLKLNTKKMVDFHTFHHLFGVNEDKDYEEIHCTRKRRKGNMKGYIDYCDYTIFHNLPILISSDEFGKNEKCGVYDHDDEKVPEYSELVVEELPSDEWIIKINNQLHDNEVMKYLEVVDAETIIRSERIDDEITVRDVDHISSSIEYINYCEKPKSVRLTFVMVLVNCCLLILLFVVLFFAIQMIRRKRMKKKNNVIPHKEIFDSNDNMTTSSSDFQISESENSSDI